MPPPPSPWGSRDPNRDYQLLVASDEEEAAESEGQQQHKPPGPGRLLALARDEAWALTGASLVLLVSSLAQVAFPKLAGDLIDVAIEQQGGAGPHAGARATNRILLQTLAVVAVGGAADGVRSWLFRSAAERLVCRLRVRLFTTLLLQEVGFYDRARTGELTNRLAEDTQMVKSAATTSISAALRAASVCLLGLGMMFATSWLLASLTLAVIPPLLLLFIPYARRSRRYMKEQLAASAGATTVAEECFSNLRTVRSFAKEDAMGARYAAAQQQALSCGLRSAVLDGAFFPLHQSLATGAVMVVLWYGARLVIAGQLSAGQLSAFVVYAVFVAANAGMLAGVLSSVVQALGAGERVFQLLDRQPAQDLRQGRLRPAGAPEGGALAFQAVWFAYPLRPSAWVLKGLTLHISPGSQVALVGPSGGGKSTCVALMERFYDPQKGAVLLDGVPLPLIDHSYLHTQIALVSQEPVLFAGSIAANIGFGCPGGGASREQLEAAARVANAHDFIAAFPQGYDTRVGERGVRLSGGQKQRVAIARAVILNPRVLLLDEATSALDAESEALVQEALERVSAGRTVVVIAHRLSTVQQADSVAVVQDGLIAEQGSHAELLAAGGVYATLVRRQLLMGQQQGQQGQEEQEQVPPALATAVGEGSADT